MKDPENDFTFTHADQTVPGSTGQRTPGPQNKSSDKSRNWQGPALVFVTCVIINITFTQWQRAVTILLGGDYQNAKPVLIYAFIGLEFSVTLFVMTAILIRSYGLVFIVSIIYAALPFAATPQSDLTLYFIIASALLISSASFSIRNEAELIIKPSIRRYFKSGASTYLTAASLAVAFCVGLNFNSSFTTIEKLVPPKVFNYYMEETHRYLPQTFTLPSGISINKDAVDSNRGIVITLPQTNESIDGYLETVAREQIARMLPDVRARAEANLTLTIEDMRNKLAEHIGIALTGQEQALTVLYKMFVIKADALMVTYRAALPIVAGAAAFALMRALGLIAYYPALILTYILMAVGQKYDLWKLEKETVTVERFRL